MVRSERYFNDGIRRIQERVVDPIMSMQMAFFGGSQEQQELAQQSMDQTVAAAPGERTSKQLSTGLRRAP